MSKWNFCAGPAVISAEVLSEVRSELSDYKNSGMSIMEMSHRSETYSNIAYEAKQDLIEILNIPKNYEVLSFPVLLTSCLPITRNLVLFSEKS